MKLIPIFILLFLEVVALLSFRYSRNRRVVKWSWAFAFILSTLISAEISRPSGWVPHIEAVIALAAIWGLISWVQRAANRPNLFPWGDKLLPIDKSVDWFVPRKG